MINSVAIILAVIGIIIQGLFIVVEHKEKYVLAVILKGSASIVFVTIGLIGLITKQGPNLLFIGLILGAIGDICLNLRFVFTKIGSKVFLLGVASFLAGHILYLIAIIKNTTPIAYCLPIGVVVAAIILFLIFTKLKVKLSYKIFGVLYIGTVVLMTSVAVGNLIVNPSTFNTIYAIGALLFTVSDIVLIFNSFGPKQLFPLRITNLTLYYFGQLLIAFSMYVALIS